MTTTATPITKPALPAAQDSAVRIGVGVFLIHSGAGTANPTFLIGKRLNAHGAGTWGLPGGHLAYGETTSGCGAREVREETGLHVAEHDVRFLTLTDDFMPRERRQYVTVFVVSRLHGQREAVVVEQDKCERWEWIDWQTLLAWVTEEIAYERREEDGEERGEAKEPERRVFLPLVNLIKQRPGVIPGFT